MGAEAGSSTLSIRRELRRATAEDHSRLDAAVGELDPFRSLDAYRDFLAAHLAARRQLRSEFGTLAAVAAAVDDTLQSDRTLAADLAALGGGVDAAPVPDVPAPAGRRDACLGVSYVFEGSLLGGTFLAAVVRDRLGPDVPLSYLDQAAVDPDRWPRAVARLDEVADLEAAVSAARRGFDVHYDHLVGPAR